MKSQPTNWRRMASAVALGVSAGLALFLAACAQFNRPAVQPPAIEGAHFVGNQACYDCHTNIVQAFAFSPHARLRLAEPPAEGPRVTGCEACHGPGSLHIQAGGGRQFIVNPGREPAACLKCHLEVEAQFHLPQRHPVLEGKLNCVQCHDPHGLDIFKPAGGPLMARSNATCGQCHREQARPFVFEHEAMREGCTVCHEPHGSINPKLLTERDNNLCLKCHAQIQGPGVIGGEILIGQVAHGDKLRMGSCWSAGCHTAVHGSNVDRVQRY